MIEPLKKDQRTDLRIVAGLVFLLQLLAGSVFACPTQMYSSLHDILKADDVFVGSADVQVIAPLGEAGENVRLRFASLISLKHGRSERIHDLQVNLWVNSPQDYTRRNAVIHGAVAIKFLDVDGARTGLSGNQAYRNRRYEIVGEKHTCGQRPLVFLDYSLIRAVEFLYDGEGDMEVELKMFELMFPQLTWY